VVQRACLAAGFSTDKQIFGVIRVIIADFSFRYAEMITRISFDLISYRNDGGCTVIVGKAGRAQVSMPRRA
jgi:hypothetical protein